MGHETRLVRRKSYGFVIAHLERDRDRPARLKEQVRIATDLLRGVRQEIRPPRR
ncbi:hypothetical protein [Methylobacterium frigidaeris]|uniref:Uncharacterized protein n=1 Tax=Methylobacterium frigidaeris TaxID=2038277 RepID=A0AA37HHE8_9HYPH|nr:hypothetical protein [Methylobacterium frigidaeris]GJD65616.1 hypothetical protein MPEAHAMD_5811 [Methylobacterium frigidaeris]